MLTYHQRPICLSWISTDLPFWSSIETAATIYQREKERFHLLLNQPLLPADGMSLPIASDQGTSLLWLELSPYRVIMTMQGNGKLGYRHFWETGIYGLSRYWLHNAEADFYDNKILRLRNFTRTLQLEGRPLPESLRLEYELWSEKVRLGHYVLHLEIQH